MVKWQIFGLEVWGSNLPTVFEQDTIIPHITVHVQVNLIKTLSLQVSMETDRVISEPFYNEFFTLIILFGAMTWLCYIEIRTV